MHENDIMTIVVKRQNNGAFLKTIEHDWLRHIGFSDKELDADEITLKLQAGKNSITISKKKGE